jgi:hypothetical protein
MVLGHLGRKVEKVALCMSLPANQQAEAQGAS